MTHTKRKWIIASLIALTAILAAVVAWAVMYYVLQVPLFDRSGWEKSEQGIRYLDYYGKPQTGWVCIDGVSYYFNPDSALLHTGWLETQDGLCYFNESGVKHTGWLETADGRYYLNEQGIIQTGWLDTADGRYYLNEQGIVHTGWLDTAEGRYYLNEQGIMQTGWLDAADGRYYLDEQGAVHTGWLDTPDGYIYFDESGQFCTGWQQIEDKTYYLTENGTPYTGWLEQGAERYYFLADGAMAVGQVQIGGVNHFFTEEGNPLIVVNPWNSVPEGYNPQLVTLEGFRISAACRDDLLAMLEACRDAGYVCELNSTYRSVSQQWALWNKRYYGYIEQGYSEEEAHQMTGSIVAYPGTSEHHLGLAVDITGTDEMYQWLAEHSWEYGFHRRYPDGKTDETGIIYEPWHFRYLGKELAQVLYEKDLTVEAYIAGLTNP